MGSVTKLYLTCYSMCHRFYQDPIRQTVVAPDQVQYYFQLAQHQAISMQQQQQQQQQGQQAPQQAPPPQQQQQQMATQVQQQQVTVSTQPQAIITSVPQQQIVTMAVSLKVISYSTFSTVHCTCSTYAFRVVTCSFPEDKTHWYYSTKFCMGMPCPEVQRQPLTHFDRKRLPFHTTSIEKRYSIHY